MVKIVLFFSSSEKVTLARRTYKCEEKVFPVTISERNGHNLAIAGPIQSL